ncbi:hypothetical protein H0H93_005413 [Arthromyces matolae]|nr:hypothetical protein H0H93_005413 [Arthromyces matolae]
MSRPPLNPEQTPSGIAVDPQTLERVVPESKRPDGTVRKEIRIRRGFTPQEDVRRFRGTRQAQMDANTLPKGQIIGWTPPAATDGKPLSKAAKKNAKRREAKRETKKDEVPEDWDDDDVDDVKATEEKPQATPTPSVAQTSSTNSTTSERPPRIAQTLKEQTLKALNLSPPSKSSKSDDKSKADLSIQLANLQVK